MDSLRIPIACGSSLLQMRSSIFKRCKYFSSVCRKQITLTIIFLFWYSTYFGAASNVTFDPTHSNSVWLLKNTYLTERLTLSFSGHITNLTIQLASVMIPFDEDSIGLVFTENSKLANSTIILGNISTSFISGNVSLTRGILSFSMRTGTVIIDCDITVDTFLIVGNESAVSEKGIQLSLSSGAVLSGSNITVRNISSQYQNALSAFSLDFANAHLVGNNIIVHNSRSSPSTSSGVATLTFFGGTIIGNYFDFFNLRAETSNLSQNYFAGSSVYISLQNGVQGGAQFSNNSVAARQLLFSGPYSIGFQFYTMTSTQGSLVFCDRNLFLVDSVVGIATTEGYTAVFFIVRETQRGMSFTNNIILVSNIIVANSSDGSGLSFSAISGWTAGQVGNISFNSIVAENVTMDGKDVIGVDVLNYGFPLFGMSLTVGNVSLIGSSLNAVQITSDGPTDISDSLCTFVLRRISLRDLRTSTSNAVKFSSSRLSNSQLSVTDVNANFITSMTDCVYVQFRYLSDVTISVTKISIVSAGPTNAFRGLASAVGAVVNTKISLTSIDIVSNMRSQAVYVFFSASKQILRNVFFLGNNISINSPSAIGVAIAFGPFLNLSHSTLEFTKISSVGLEAVGVSHSITTGMMDSCIFIHTFIVVNGSTGVNFNVDMTFMVLNTSMSQANISVTSSSLTKSMAAAFQIGIVRNSQITNEHIKIYCGSLYTCYAVNIVFTNNISNSGIANRHIALSSAATPYQLSGQAVAFQRLLSSVTPQLFIYDFKLIQSHIVSQQRACFVFYELYSTSPNSVLLNVLIEVRNVYLVADLSTPCVAFNSVSTSQKFSEGISNSTISVSQVEVFGALSIGVSFQTTFLGITNSHILVDSVTAGNDSTAVQFIVSIGSVLSNCSIFISNVEVTSASPAPVIMAFSGARVSYSAILITNVSKAGTSNVELWSNPSTIQCVEASIDRSNLSVSNIHHTTKENKGFAFYWLLNELSNFTRNYVTTSNVSTILSSEPILIVPYSLSVGCILYLQGSVEANYFSFKDMAFMNTGGIVMSTNSGRHVNNTFSFMNISSLNSDSPGISMSFASVFTANTFHADNIHSNQCDAVRYETADLIFGQIVDSSSVISFNVFRHSNIKAGLSAIVVRGQPALVMHSNEFTAHNVTIAPYSENRTHVLNIHISEAFRLTNNTFEVLNVRAAHNTSLLTIQQDQAPNSSDPYIQHCSFSFKSGSSALPQMNMTSASGNSLLISDWHMLQVTASPLYIDWFPNQSAVVLDRVIGLENINLIFSEALDASNVTISSTDVKTIRVNSSLDNRSHFIVCNVTIQTGMTFDGTLSAGSSLVVEGSNINNTVVLAPNFRCGQRQACLLAVSSTEVAAILVDVSEELDLNGCVYILLNKNNIRSRASIQSYSSTDSSNRNNDLFISILTNQFIGGGGGGGGGGTCLEVGQVGHADLEIWGNLFLRCEQRLIAGSRNTLLVANDGFEANNTANATYTSMCNGEAACLDTDKLLRCHDSNHSFSSIFKIEREDFVSRRIRFGGVEACTQLPNTKWHPPTLSASASPTISLQLIETKSLQVNHSATMVVHSPTRTATHTMDLPKPVKPVPPYDSAATTTGTVTGATVAVIAVLSSGGGVGGQLGVANAMARIATCSDDGGEEGLPTLVHPLQFDFGNAKSQSSVAAAAVISNCIIVPLIVILLAQGPAVWLQQRFKRVSNRQLALTILGWPSLVLMPFITLAEGIGLTIIRSLRSMEEKQASGGGGTAMPIMVGIVGSAIILCVLGLWTWGLLFVVPRRHVALEPAGADGLPTPHIGYPHSSPIAKRTFLVRVLMPRYYWVPLNRNKDFESTYTSFLTDATLERYENLLGGKRIFVAELVSFVCSLWVGIAEGIPSAYCKQRAVLALVAVVIQSVCSVMTVVPVELILQSLLSLCIVPLSIIATVSVFKDKDEADTPSSSSDLVDTALALFSIAGNVVGVFLMFVSLGTAVWRMLTFSYGKRKTIVHDSYVFNEDESHHTELHTLSFAGNVWGGSHLDTPLVHRSFESHPMSHASNDRSRSAQAEEEPSTVIRLGTTRHHEAEDTDRQKTERILAYVERMESASNYSGNTQGSRPETTVPNESFP